MCVCRITVALEEEKRWHVVVQICRQAQRVAVDQKCRDGQTYAGGHIGSAAGVLTEMAVGCGVREHCDFCSPEVG